MRALLILLLATACLPATTPGDGKETGLDVDNDGDGYVGAADCDEEDGTVHDGAAELCDGLDNDCDGEIDDGSTNSTVFYLDADGDGFGDPAQPLSACAAPEGYVASAGDCDDHDVAYNPDAAEDGCADPNDYNCDGSVGYADSDGDGIAACEDCDDADDEIFPGAVEVCNGVDDDCSGAIDDNAVDALTFYEDADTDGFGTDVTLVACEQPAGYAEYSGDCDDTSAAWHPNASETDCTDPNDYNCDGSVGYDDADGDGYAACTECDDASADHFPGAVELCNDVDDNCDTVIDESTAADATIWYSDADGDTYGDAATTLAACDQPSAYVLDTTDCDDSNAAEFPGADELCDGDDDNCDGVVDESTAIDASTWYDDADTDGYGDPADSQVACTQPSGWLASAGDCDDTDEAEYPGADERCDGDDDNCDGAIDEDTAVDASTWYADADADGYGDAASTTVACSMPSGFVADTTDCDDTTASVNPAALELCNAVDDNCDGDVDESTAGDAITWYADTDADGYGDAGSAIVACEMPSGFSATDDDCDDEDATENPAADERCDGDDDDCDGVVDEDAAIDVATWFLDADADGYGDAAWSDIDCDQPSGYVSDSTDCDDAAPGENPGEIEVCDSANVDEDCSGSADDADAGVTGATAWFADADGDSYGDSTISTTLCDQPAGYVADDLDCDDADGDDHPGAPETVGNSDDEDCNGGELCWVDADSDGYRPMSSSSTVISVDDDCADAGEGTNAEPETDCDDADATENPAATERCDGDDDDCDTEVDEDSAVDVATWFADADSDGYGDAAASEIDCDQPSGYVSDSTDCDDTETGVNPGEVEVCDAANVDEDCNELADDADVGASGRGTWYADSDSDGYGDLSVSTTLCDRPAAYVADATDCDDGDIDVNPGEAEICDPANVDEDCNELADDDDSGASGQASFYADGDSDAYGDSAVGVSVCDQPPGYVTDDTDCDDALDTVYPGAPETTANGRDDNCDGAELCYEDDDNDGYVDGSLDTRFSMDGDCSDAYEALSSATSGDCDEADAAINPGATEVCDSVDNDCDTVVDDGLFVDWYADSDGDGYGDAGTSTYACSAPTDYVADDTDCDDVEATVYPGAPTICGDLLVNDCGGSDTGCELTGGGLITSYDQASWFGITASDNVGVSGAGVGDINGDGNDDILFGANTYDPTGMVTNAGRAWLYAGGALSGDTELSQSTTGYATFSGSSTTNADYLGFQVSSAGSFVGATTADVLIGAPNMKVGTFSVAGEAYVFSNPVGATSKTGASLIVQGRAGSDNVGYDVSGGYDVNDDGRDDAVVGAYGYDTGSSSSIYDGMAGVFFGGTTGTKLVTAASAAFTATAGSSDQAGQVVALVPDISGDGIGDIVICAYKADSTATDSGTAYVVFGDASLTGGAISTTVDATLTGPAVASAQLCRSVDSAGDFDGDGDDDLLLGADGASNGSSTSGAAYVFASPVVSGAASTASIRLTGYASGDFFGRAVAGGGDFNGDGNDDIGISATSFDLPLSGVGVAGVWYGPLSAGTYASTTADFAVTGVVLSDALGASMDFVGDTDADGFDDLLVGATNFDSPTTGLTNVGAVFLILGAGN
ncbi:hypothetical protein LBMAG42_04170 [Deltaproteobacteria bacterium]|nr:hypothetical protein LBMAG42_04170 [Deltaproteobacteria bacterium]